MTARTLVEARAELQPRHRRLLMDTLRCRSAGLLAWADSGQAPRDGWTCMPRPCPPISTRVRTWSWLNSRLKEFDLAALGARAGRHNADQQFSYLGLQTLYDRLLHPQGLGVVSMPQIFFMRVAMGLAIEESDRNGPRHRVLQAAVELRLYGLDADPVQRRHPAPATVPSCYLTTVPDRTVGHLPSDMTTPWLFQIRLAAWATDWTNVPCTGASYIKGTNRKIPRVFFVALS